MKPRKARVEFEYELPSGDILWVEADVEPGRPARLYGEPGDCYPAEPAEVEFTCYLINNQEHPQDFDPDGLWIRKWKDHKLTMLSDDIEDYAIDKADEMGDW
jgi:hypothetical protein|tara:strand:- start:315 stop:620 length:306 start_codon:yes stop_codon:yes gene_type:complete